ncbi:MAG: hypothetical protein K2G84_08710, partial [Muribaculaceae bacterium]|nr:hypothetical protein [Muribaculaceae bacterium]
MARTKISKVAKDLNVALPTVVDFLRGKNITIDDNPNARIEDEVVDLLVKEFKNDKDQKTKSEQFSSERMQQREKTKPAARPVDEIKLSSEINKPKILGKIELDKHGNPIRHSEPAAPVAQEEPKAPATVEAPVEKTPEVKAAGKEAVTPVAPEAVAEVKAPVEVKAEAPAPEKAEVTAEGSPAPA